MESNGESRKFGAKCFIENNGKVNCSDIIYEDEKSWKVSRVQIDLLIKVLKNKISDLKDIKKHLKEHKPVHMKDYDEIPSVEDDDSRPIIRKHNQLHHINQIENPNYENRTFETDDKQFEVTSSVPIHPRINTTVPRTHHRPKGNRSHWNSYRQHHGKKVNLEDLFADNKAKDRMTTMAPGTTNSLKESDIVSSYGSSSRIDMEPITETTKNYFEGLESTTKFIEEIHTETATRRKMTYDMSGELQLFFLEHFHLT